MNRRTRQSGFSFSEVVVAMAVILIGGGIFVFFFDNMRINESARQQTEAIAAMRNVLDTIRINWRDVGAYETARIPASFPAPDGYTHMSINVSVTPGTLGVYGDFDCQYVLNESGRSLVVQSCPSQADSISRMRDIVILMWNDENEDVPRVELVYQIVRPVTQEGA